MPESIFKQISLDILKLHRDSVYSLLATSGCNCQVHEAAYVNIDGKYYISLSCEPEVGEVKTGILLIEDESRNLRLSWVGSARELDRKDSVYKRALSALSRKLGRCKDRLHTAVQPFLLELVSEKGRFSVGDEEVWISRNDLVRALYPVGYSMRQAMLQI